MALQFTRDFILQVRELLERNLDAVEIAHRLHIDVSVVQQVVLNILT